MNPQDLMIRYNTHDCADAFAEELSMLGAEAIPTSRACPPSGDCPYRDWCSTTAALPSGTMIHCTSAGSMLGYGGTTGEHFGMVMPWVHTKPAIHQGVEMSRTGISLYGPNTQHVGKYNAASAFTVCIFDQREVHKHLARLLGREDAGLREGRFSVLNLPPAARRGFEDTVRAVEGLRAELGKALPCPSVMASIENRIFDLIAEAMGGDLDTSCLAVPRHASRLKMVAACWELSRHQLNVNLTLGDLCVAAQASARILQYAFLEFSGMTPKTFLRNHRLTRARRMLLSGEARSVKEAAYSCGFIEPGRFSTYYRELFGEYPSESRILAWAEDRG